jgi:pimeloyl-ACP methyl ester carboxylesterase
MPESSTPQELDLGGLPSWYREIFPAGPNDGFFIKKGVHSLSFVDRGVHQLVVSFDNLSDAGNPRYDREPWAGKFCADNGWSHLGVYSQMSNWFRNQDLIDILEKLKSDNFFKQFDRVAFCGTSMGGFGALTFSSLAPGATVIAFSPQITLDNSLVPWEKRFVKGRNSDWNLAYSDAAEQIKNANRVYVVYDPFYVADKIHFERLSGDNVIPLQGFGLGHKSALVLRKMDALKPIMAGAIKGSLSPRQFYKIIRSRKDIYLYRQNIESYLTERDREQWIPMFRNAFKARRRDKAK